MSWSHRHSHAAQRAVRPGTGRTSPKACGVQEGDHQGSRERLWTVTTGVAKTRESCTGQIHCCDNPLGQRAEGLERSVESVALLRFSLSVRDRTTPCERPVKDRDRDEDRDRDRGFGCIAASCVPSPLCGSCLSCVLRSLSLRALRSCTNGQTKIRRLLFRHWF